MMGTPSSSSGADSPSERAADPQSEYDDHRVLAVAVSDDDDDAPYDDGPMHAVQAAALLVKRSITYQMDKVAAVVAKREVEYAASNARADVRARPFTRAHTAMCLAVSGSAPCLQL